MKSNLQQNNSPYDLHVHSMWSDGEDNLNKILRKAMEKRLKAFAICDHNILPPNLDQLILHARKYLIKVIKGIEISSQIEVDNGFKLNFHVLGYYLNCDNELLSRTLKETLAGYQRRGEKILEKCEKLGLPLDYKMLRESCQGFYLSRNTIAEAISKATGIDFRAALKIAFVEDKEDMFLDTFHAISLIKESGGIPFLAHPAKHIEFILGVTSESTFKKMIKSGLKGIEVLHPSHREADVVKLYELARNYGLLITGGTDYHGINRPPFTNLGDLGISSGNFVKLEKALIEAENLKNFSHEAKKKLHSINLM